MHSWVDRRTLCRHWTDIFSCYIFDRGHSGK